MHRDKPEYKWVHKNTTSGTGQLIEMVNRGFRGISNYDGGMLSIAIIP